MIFTPKTDGEIQRQALIPEGTYQATLVNFCERDQQGNPLMTKKGDPKFNVSCKIYDSEGKSKNMFDDIGPYFIKKFKHFCDAVGLQNEYNTGKITEEDGKEKIGNNFVVEIGTYSYKKNKGQANEEEVISNCINDYLLIKKPNFPSGASTTPAIDDFKDDDVPF